MIDFKFSAVGLNRVGGASPFPHIGEWNPLQSVDSCSPIVTLFMSRGTEELVDGLHRVLGSIDFPRQEQTDSIFSGGKGASGVRFLTQHLRTYRLT